MEEEQGAAVVATAAKKKHEEKFRKKDPRSWENVSKCTSNMDKPERLAYIETKYKELYNEIRTLTANNQQLTRQCAALQKERDHNQAELAKSVMTRARLEGICRELQKQNKQIKDENLAKIKEEEERRKEVSLKFADKLTDINNMMDENKEKSDQLREENLKMTTKLADLYSQFQKREEDISKMSHQLELERQYSQATLAKMELEIKAEKELHLKEQAIMKSNLEKSEANCCVLLETVKGLQDHIDVYKHQYDDFETTMSKSAKVFDNFKFEIANMTKQVNTLELEAQSWKTKFHDSMKALVEMSEVKKNQEMHIQSLDKKNEQLNKLCRQLQIDRSNYLKQLKGHGIEPSTSVCPVEEETVKKVTPKPTKKEKQLLLLRDNLKTLQDELNHLTTDENKTEQTSQSEENSAKSSTNQESISSQEVLISNEKNEDTPVIDSQQKQNEGKNKIEDVFISEDVVSGADLNSKE